MQPALGVVGAVMHSRPSALAVGARKAALIALALAAAGQAAAASPAGKGTLVLRGEQAYSVALPLLIQRGQLAEALQLIRAMPADLRAEEGVALLEADLLRRTGARRTAVDVYRRLLARDSGNQRARLELAQTLFDLKDLRTAEYQFRRALSGSLPEADRRLARQYLSRILDLRPWTVAAGLGLAPDSNINGGSSAQQVELWGLPFTLSKEARRRGGFGVRGYVSGQASARLGPGVKLVGQAWAEANEGRETQFSSEVLSTRLGPEFVAANHRWSISATSEQVWYGRRRLYDGIGGELAGDLSVDGGRTTYSASASAQSLDYRDYEQHDGWLYGLSGARTHYQSPRAFWRLSGAVRAKRADAASESYDQARLAIGAYRTLPLRLGVFLEPSVSIRRNRDRDPLFNVVREDHEASLALRMIKEDYSVWGLSPYLSAQISRTDSNIEVYSFDRTRIEFGLTRTF